MIESLIRFFYFFVSIVIYGVNLVQALRLKFLEKFTIDAIFVFNLSVILFSIYFMSTWNYSFGFFVYLTSIVAFLLVQNRNFFEKFKKFFRMELSFDNILHRIFLSLSVYILLNPIVTLAVSSNLMILLSGFIELLDQVAFQFVIFVFAFVGIGFGTRRNLKQSIKRLNIGIPSIKYVILGLILLLIVDRLIWGAFDFFVYLFQHFDPALSEHISDRTITETANVENTVQKIKDVTTTPLKIAFLSIIVGISEELMFRGAIQPRFGNIYTSLIFAALHAQYLSSIVLLDVFFISYILGRIKEKSCVTTVILIHILYDMLSLLF